MFPDLFLGWEWHADRERVDAFFSGGSDVDWMEGRGGGCRGVEDVDYFMMSGRSSGTCEGVAEGGQEGLDVCLVVGVRA